ncbi:MAG: DUF433 domain-containing protein [Bauldia sp.]|nr:DUF433 domain-containing protein [Bauldia sp.]
MSDAAIRAAFNADTASRLTGITKRQLSYWAPDFFPPSLGARAQGRGHARLYSFRDIVALRVLNALRNEAGISLPHLREVREQLLHLGDDMWSKTVLYVVNGRVAFVNPETDEVEDVLSGQGVLQIPLAKVTGDTSAAVRNLFKRDPTSFGHVDRKRNVAGNQPVVAGTRIPVSTVKAYADAGFSSEEIRAEYPSLTEADIAAALAYDAAA